MIKLFITDIDGCISTPFVTPEWKTITTIRELNRLSSTEEHVPPLSICSGRPFAYVEAVAQWLDITIPVVFESAGIFDPGEYTVTTNEVFDDAASESIEELKQWLQAEIIPDHDGMIVEFSKHMDAGLIHPDSEIIMEVYPRICDYVNEKYDDFEVHYTDVSINIVAKANNKRTGIRDLCTRLNLDVSEVAYIGDSSGDIPGLNIVGMPFAPANAAPQVKEAAQEAPFESTRAVLWAYEQIIKYNKKAITQKSAPQP